MARSKCSSFTALAAREVDTLDLFPVNCDHPKGGGAANACGDWRPPRASKASRSRAGQAMEARDSREPRSSRTHRPSPVDLLRRFPLGRLPRERRSLLAFGWAASTAKQVVDLASISAMRASASKHLHRRELTKSIAARARHNPDRSPRIGLESAFPPAQWRAFAPRMRRGSQGAKTTRCPRSVQCPVQASCRQGRADCA
jgi:hypothetical protein